ncbi:MAG: Zn-dependent alcohol dehydrogenase [Candidatus Moranbacteria bacterium GW2011_GWC2_37_8]|nr:MAG: Zn-dependent alcohol dehydrogenase [Candidatus Moranbacteria bacterium GW2011_GWC2_37_8]KKQ62257.1 MAG: Zn-dependent alcohol dehydrogenase [Parcubacteria group bacterium GW2011_GWC1_38_22]KKQ81011.1 MAG: Zn-dependent alcohol dehydrogenase [Candidatus Moranbacteria bacterium GW2011_GWD2_38_7]
MLKKIANSLKFKKTKKIPTEMKAAVVVKFGKPLVIKNIPVPGVTPGQILVKVAACGVCHTDLHAANGDWPVKPSLPFVPGHEGVGTVVELGEGVTDIKIGDRVGIPWLHTSCGHCEHCLTGWETLCAKQQMTGYTVNGSFAEYVLADPNYVGRIPENLSFTAVAPILCAGVTVYKGLKETETKPGQWVVISGVGGLGHLAVQYAKAMGLRVIAVDIADSKLKLAKKVGAELTFNANKVDAAVEINKVIGGAHGVLVTAVSTKAFEQAVNMLRAHGTMSLVGLPPGKFPISIFDLVLGAKTVRGSIVGTRKDLEECLEIASRGLAKATIKVEKLENINSIFDRMKKGKIDGRIVMKMED